MNKSTRQSYHSNLALLFLNDIQYLRSNYFYFIGKTDKWATLDVAPSITSSLSAQEDMSIRNNATFFKRITQNDVSLVTARYDWESGIVIPQWDHTLPMNGVGFYRFTDEYNVYVCLDNAENAVSTVKPTGKSFYPVRTADGYLWKYVYTVPAYKRRRFGNPSYIPIQRALTDSFYNKGSIDSAVPLSAGSGYSGSALTNIVVSGATTGTGASASISVNVSGVITSITLISGGSGYTHGVDVKVSSTSGIGAVLTPTIVGGVITNIAITTGGIGYTIGDPVLITVGGFAAYPVISRDTGSILDVKITNYGIGYVTAPTLTVTTASTGSGAYGNATALLEAVSVDGIVKRVLIRDPGVDYPVDASTTITVTGDGTGARFSPVVYNGEITDVIVEDPGSGYSNIQLTVVGSGTGALLTAALTSSDYNSEQSIVEQSAVVGAIYTVKLTAGGLGYTNTTIATISGDGTGATAEVFTFQGAVTKIKILTAGSGYTYATVQLSDVNRFDPLSAIPVATAYCILPPLNGHGFDVVDHLNGDTIAISSSLRVEPLLNPISQDYRQFGLLKNPRSLQTNKLVKADTSVDLFTAKVTTSTGLVIDEILVLGTTEYRVIYVNGNVVTLQPVSSKLTSPVGTLIAKTDNSRQYVCTEMLTQPIVNKYTGSLLYVSNENPFSFTNNQGILIKTYLKF